MGCVQVDSFRWDIMGHLMLSNMHNVLVALGALTLEGDGVDGAAIQQYAEAWSFGEVEHQILFLSYTFPT